MSWLRHPTLLVAELSGAGPQLTAASPPLLEMLGLAAEDLPVTPWGDGPQGRLMEQLGSGGVVDLDELSLKTSGGDSIPVRLQGIVTDGVAEVVVSRFTATAAASASAALRELTNRHQLALESAGIGMWDWNIQDNSVHFDARWCEMLGYRQEELAPTYNTWARRVHPEDLDLALQLIQAHVLGESETYEVVHRLRHRDGSWRHILTRGRVVARDGNGGALRFVGAHADVTLERESELQALELVRSRTLFLATMSHEIRTPLHGLLGAIEVMELHDLPEPSRDLLEVMRASGELLMAVVNDALELARTEHEELVVNMEAFDLAALVRHTVDLHREQRASDAVTVRLELLGKVGWVRGDRNRLRQILGNLLGNAIRFTEEGAVVLRVRQVEEQVIFEVNDTGPGIEHVHSIWRPFSLGDSSMARKHSGTGLGLTITRALVEGLGGSIGVVSEVGAGTSFRVELPFAVCSATVSRGPVLEETGRSLNVVVVDDNPVNRMVAVRLLQSLGHVVRSAESGREALVLCAVQDPDVMLLDLHMPGLDGIQTLQALRAQGSSSVALAVTADVSASERGVWTSAGFQGYLGKPFTQQHLRQALAAAFALRPPREPVALG